MDNLNNESKQAIFLIAISAVFVGLLFLLIGVGAPASKPVIVLAKGLVTLSVVTVFFTVFGIVLAIAERIRVGGW